MSAPLKFAAIGECMLEFSSKDCSEYTLSYAGDTFNVAIYFSRTCHQFDAEVYYVTALGDDPYSTQMIVEWSKENIRTEFVKRIPDRLPGLYLIKNDARGERHFYYYRSQSAARYTFDGEEGENLCEALLEMQIIYLSGITLAILSPEGKDKILLFLKKAKDCGIKICFDSNYRSRLWSEEKTARSVIQIVYSYADIALPSFDDEKLLFGDNSPLKTAQRIHDYGVTEVVVKQGAKGYLLSTQDSKYTVPISPVKHVVDTTAAGDSFNGVYLAQRLCFERSQREASDQASKMAAKVIRHKGAILPV